MKKASEIRNQINENYNRIKELKANQTEQCSKIDRWTKDEKLTAAINETAGELLDAQIRQKILKSNHTVATINEVLPVALEVLKKYEGKPYGEKTAEKIRKEVLEKTGYRLYIESDNYTFYPSQSHGDRITCGPRYENRKRKALLIDNKIQVIPVDEFELGYVSHEYVEDVEERIQILKEKHQAAYEAQEALRKAVKEYDSLAVGEIKHLYGNHNIYARMDV